MAHIIIRFPSMAQFSYRLNPRMFTCTHEEIETNNNDESIEKKEKEYFK